MFVGYELILSAVKAEETVSSIEAKDIPPWLVCCYHPVWILIRQCVPLRYRESKQCMFVAYVVVSYDIGI